MTSMRNIAMELEYKAIPNQIKALGSIEQHVPQVVLLARVQRQLCLRCRSSWQSVTHNVYES